jgi:poly(beta-D-mannuronate) lyase
MMRSAGAVLAALLIATPCLADPALRAPALMLRPSDPQSGPPPQTCGAPPAPVRSLELTSFYQSGTAAQRAHADQVDPAALASYEKQVAGLHQYQFELTKRVDLYMRSGNRAMAGCVLEWLQVWAASDAMLAPMSLQGRFEQKWHAAAVCISYLKISAAAGLAPDKLVAVRPYLLRLGRAARDGNHADGRPLGDMAADDVVAHNNHAYWAGLAAAACAIAGDDRPLFDWGTAQYRMAMADVTPDGFLPLEVKRGARALGYHAMSLDALVMLATLAEANGLRPSDEAGGALHRLAATVAKGFLDPQIFAQASGTKQEANATFADYHLSWAELYHARFSTTRKLPELERILAAHRPVGDRYLGGDVTLTLSVAAH